MFLRISRFGNRIFQTTVERYKPKALATVDFHRLEKFKSENPSYINGRRQCSTATTTGTSPPPQEDKISKLTTSLVEKMMKQDKFESEYDQEESNEPELVLKMRGLPWSCTLDDVVEFFGGAESGIRGGHDGIHLVQSPEGRASGEGFVEFTADDDLVAALKKDRNSMGHRYIEVFQVKRAEMEWVLRRNRPISESSSPFQGTGGECECFVRLRGLPYECSKEDIAQFFDGLEIVLVQLVDDGGRNTGEAYVQFTSKDQAEQALLRDRQCIGHRYIELFRIGVAEMRSLDMFVPRNNRSSYSNNRPGPYDRDRNQMNSNGSGRGGRYGNQQQRGGGRYFSKGFEDDTWNNYANEVGSAWNKGGGHSVPPPPPVPLIPGLKNRGGHSGNGGSSNGYCVLMRGLPYRATDDDIQAFFDPLVPRGIRIIYNDANRPSGTAKVLFASQDDVNLAMSKNKNRMEHRYIELFISSP